MIYTVTFNPSLDYVVKVEHFCSGTVNRAQSEAVYSGGKGINVSIILTRLGVYNTALGFIAGFTGAQIEKGVREMGCKTDFIPVKNGMSRINIKLKSDDESEINGIGPVISKQELDALFTQLECLKDGDILVLAGSIPSCLPEDIYEKIMERLSGRNLRFVVDATGDLLLRTLKYHPFLIKPNKHELGDFFGVSLTSREDIIEYAKKLQEKGADNVLVSMAGEGAILLSKQGELFQSAAPAGKVKNSVGAGDSMVAGFLAGYLQHGNYGEAFKTGLAAGSASAFSEDLATREKIYEILAAL